MVQEDVAAQVEVVVAHVLMWPGGTGRGLESHVTAGAVPFVHSAAWVEPGVERSSFLSFFVFLFMY